MAEPRFRTKQTDRLVKALLSLDSEEQCYCLLEDLFTIREIKDLSQRMEVAEKLLKKVTYSEIAQETGVSSATIGRVNRALNYGAGGYQIVFDKIGLEDE